VISQRENVLSAIGSLSRSPSVTISQDDILKFFEKYFYSMIQQEVHEGLICHMLQQMTNWCSRLTSVNQTLTEFFKVSQSFFVQLSFSLVNYRKDLSRKQVHRLRAQRIFNVCQ
jgi:hypothetical protein